MLKKLIGGLVILFYKVFYFRRLQIKIPSISFNLTPFNFSSYSKTQIGEKAIIQKQSQIINRSKITIGNNFFLNKNSRVVAFKEIVIGDNVTIAQFVSILDHDHDYVLKNNRMQLSGYKTSPIIIGNNVWIADKVTICKGVVIGDNVVIAANSVVTKNVPSNSVFGGVPAKFLKKIVKND